MEPNETCTQQELPIGFALGGTSSFFLFERTRASLDFEILSLFLRAQIDQPQRLSRPPLRKRLVRFSEKKKLGLTGPKFAEIGSSFSAVDKEHQERARRLLRRRKWKFPTRSIFFGVTFSGAGGAKQIEIDRERKIFRYTGRNLTAGVQHREEI